MVEDMTKEQCKQWAKDAKCSQALVREAMEYAIEQMPPGYIAIYYREKMAASLIEWYLRGKRGASK